MTFQNGNKTNHLVLVARSVHVGNSLGNQEMVLGKLFFFYLPYRAGGGKRMSSQCNSWLSVLMRVS